MGGSTNITARYFGNTRFEEFYFKLGDILNIINIYEDKVSIGINNDSILKSLKEFNLENKTNGFIDLKRFSYEGSKKKCCLENINHYWIKDNNITYPSLESSLYTCNPRSKSLGYDSYCDDIMIKECIKNEKYNDKCFIWFNNLSLRKELFSDVIKLMFNKCTNSIEDNIYCKELLENIRYINDDEFNEIADTILNSQKDKSNLKCAFSPKYIEDEETKIVSPKECWYKECVNSETWKLLKKNINRRNICSLSECNINIYDLNMIDTTDIKITCKNKNENKINNDINNILVSESKYKMFLITRYDLIIIFFLLFLLYIVLYFI